MKGEGETVPLLREPHPFWTNTSMEPPIHVRRLARFAWSASGTYVHRPRSALIHNDARNFPNSKKLSGPRLTVSTWCGMLLHRPRLGGSADGRIVCATCDGRAVANGHPSLDGRTPDARLTFKPRRCMAWGTPAPARDACGYRR